MGISFQSCSPLFRIRRGQEDMDSSRGGGPWGKLVKVDSSETLLLFNKECTVGRKKGDIVFYPEHNSVDISCLL